MNKSKPNYTSPHCVYAHRKIMSCNFILSLVQSVNFASNSVTSDSRFSIEMLYHICLLYTLHKVA